MRKRILAVIGGVVVVFVGLTLWNRAAQLSAGEDDLLAKTDVLAEFFDGTLSILSLAAKAYEMAPTLATMDELLASVPVLKSIVLYDADGTVNRAVPSGAIGPDSRLLDDVVYRHIDRAETALVTADSEAHRLRLSRVVTGDSENDLKILVLTISIRATLARLPEAFEAPVVDVELLDASGRTAFFYKRIDSEANVDGDLISNSAPADIGPVARLLHVGNDRRMTSGKQLRDFPLQLVLAFDRSAVLSRWRQTTIASAIVLGFLLLVTIATEIGRRRQWDRRVAVEHQVQTLSKDVDTARDRLQTARDELGDFAYVVAHDLKAPLRGISQLSQWIVADQSEKLDESGVKMLEMLVDRVSRMNDMIEAILRFSRVNRDTLKLESVDLQELVEKTIEDIAVPESVTVVTATDLPTVQGDYVQLRRLFQNLIDNAARVVVDSCGTVAIEVDTTDRESWIVSVRDDGPGIDPKYHDQIFRPLQTIEGTRSETGTGMGLAICRKIAVRHGGSLSVQSAVGEGTVMTVTLPRGGAG